MSGEYSLAKKVIEEALQLALEKHHMDRETLLNALLNEVIQEVAKDKDQKDTLNMVQFIINNLSAKEFLITRGC